MRPHGEQNRKHSRKTAGVGDCDGKACDWLRKFTQTQGAFWSCHEGAGMEEWELRKARNGVLQHEVQGWKQEVENDTDGSVRNPKCFHFDFILQRERLAYKSSKKHCLKLLLSHYVFLGSEISYFKFRRFSKLCCLEEADYEVFPNIRDCVSKKTNDG